METATNPPITIIIPAYNEEQSIGRVIEELQKIPTDSPLPIIVVDDGSSDRTAEVAESYGVSVIRHSRNRGYGASIKSGIRQAETEYVLTYDADGQHRPEDAMLLWQAAAGYDMVVGKRTSLIHSPAWRMPGKWILGWVANYLSQQKIPDLNSGLRVIKRQVALRYLHLCPAGFSLSTTITMALLNRGYSILYLPIEAKKRVGKSTVTIASGFDTFVLILRLAALFNPLRFFLPLSLLFCLVGVLWGIPYAMIRGAGLSVGSMLAIFTGIQLFVIGMVCDQISQLRLERYE